MEVAVLVEMRPARTERWKRPALVAGALLVVAIALFIVVSLTSGPKFVSQLTVVNPTAYDLQVDATDGGHHGWTALGTAGRSGTDSFQDVVDQGDTWILRFSYGGQTAGELRFTHQELAGAQWRVAVPASFGEALRGGGTTPPPS
jgi:hypothetical protein